MILRVWRAKLDPARIDEYGCFEQERCLPMLRKQPGFLRVLFSRSSEDGAISITIWEDRGTVEALESSPSYRRSIRELAESRLLAGEQSVEMLEVKSGTLRLEPLAATLNTQDEQPYPGGATT
jgi:heme-degrading monooxygenase HmoA